MDKVNKQELRRLAEAATFGPWESVERTGYDGEHYFLIQTQEERNGWEVAEIRMDVPHDNASFIAAANPAAILSLLDELERLEANHNQLNHGVAVAATSEWNRLAEENDQLRAELEQYRKDAERWRKCKTMPKSWWLEAMASASRPHQHGGRSMDAAIDAAMAKEGGANG